MVRRDRFLEQGMFDFHFSPGYYEDTDLAFTVRAAGLRVLCQPFAHVVHQSHTTYAGSTDGLISRNRQHFTSKWSAALQGHMPPCEGAAACTQASSGMEEGELSHLSRRRYTVDNEAAAAAARRQRMPQQRQRAHT